MYRVLLKIIPCLFFCCFFISSASYAVQYELEMNVNNRTFEGALGYSTLLNENTLGTRFNYIYKKDRYKKGGGELMLGNRFLSDRLDIRLGFNGIYGKITDLNKNPEISNIGFVLQGEFTLPEKDLPFPIVVGNKISIAPEPMSFEETKTHFQYRAHADFNILSNAGLTMGYRYFKTEFEDNFYKDHYSEHSLFIGYKLKFEVK